MRTDTQRLDWILAALDSGNGEPFERLQAAYTLELRGRPAMDAAMGAKVIEPGEPMPALTAIDLAVAELGRIRNVKGFSEARDDSDLGTHDLAYAAATYLTPDESRHEGTRSCPDTWPWSPNTFKPSPDDRKKELTKGIALALCELDRLIRAERRELAEAEKVGDAFRHGDYRVERRDDEGKIGVPQPREFKVGDRVRCAQSGYVGLPDPIFGTIKNLGFEGAFVQVDGCVGGRLYWAIAELEHVDD